MRVSYSDVYGLALLLALQAPAAQNPSPMVEHTRPHPRLVRNTPDGRRETLQTGTVFVPKRLAGKRVMPLIVHFHGVPWVVEANAARYGRAAVVSIQVGSGSGVYERAMADVGRLGALVAEAEAKLGVRLDPLLLSAWSAGYGAIRMILGRPADYSRVAGVLLVDGLHTGYEGGRPGPLESKLETGGLQVFLTLARDAAAGRKRLVLTHSEIFPGTFASTTETADYLVAQLGLTRRPVLRRGPMGTQQLSEARQGGLRIVGYAGNSAPDHVDQLHALAWFWKWLH